MADLEDATPAEDEPDLSDLTIATVNVETREGRQLSMVWAADGGLLSLSTDGHQTDGETFEKWTFTITQTLAP